MAASTQFIADITTVITNGPNAASLALALAAAGPIQDYKGNTASVKLKLQEVVVAANLVKAATDSTDTTNLGLINGILAALNGTSTPSGTVVADISTVITNGPNAATTAKAIAPAGPIVDYVGMLHNVRLKLKETKVLLARVIQVTDATDSANLTLLSNLNLGLV